MVMDTLTIHTPLEWIAKKILYPLEHIFNYKTLTVQALYSVNLRNHWKSIQVFGDIYHCFKTNVLDGFKGDDDVA